MIKYFLIAACMFAGLCSCQKDGLSDNDISSAAKTALMERYPQATDIKWSIRQGYSVAEFNIPVTKSVELTRYVAWFDDAGKWYMTESDLLFEMLPEPVRTSFKAGEYASWRIDDIDQVMRGELDVIYVIEVESYADGVEKEMDLYYSADGILVKQVADTGDDYDYSDYIPSQPSTGITAFIEDKYPGARIIDIDSEDGVTEVEIYHDNRQKDVYFNGAGEWIDTRWDILQRELPDAVKNTVSSSEYASYNVDDIEFVQTPVVEYYILELERGDKEVQLRIRPDGVII